MLASDKDGDVVAARGAIIRRLQGMGADIHDVADRIEHSGNGALKEHEMQEIFDAGVKTGIKQIVQKLHNNLGVTAQFPSASDMAMYCYQRSDRLNEWGQELRANRVGWQGRKT